MPIAEHLQNIFASGELAEDSVCRKFRQTAAGGKNYQVKYYNLDARKCESLSKF